MPGSTPSCASPVHAGGHGIPDPIEARGDLLVGAQGLFVASRGLGDRDALFVAQLDERGRVIERERERRGRDARRLALAPDESSADRVVGVFRDHVVSHIARNEGHGVGVAGQTSPWLERDVGLVETDRVRPGEQESTSVGPVHPQSPDGIRIDGLRIPAVQPCDDGVRRPVPDTCRAE